MNHVKHIKAIIKKTIVTYNGTLYKDEIVKVMVNENGHCKVRDSMGKIWHISNNKFKELPYNSTIK